ncbi:MAG: hypothetical protein QNJ46_24400 [Leptolyngbyaceae cyanobacterium MO_188.B28]|nr:hypothetical protein [Leptolyngbyaceae cyanobacterium MO_188.B28]
MLTVLCTNLAALDLSQAVSLEAEVKPEGSAIEAQTEEGSGTIVEDSQTLGDTEEGVQVIVPPTIGNCGEENESQVCSSSNQIRLIIEIK